MQDILDLASRKDRGLLQALKPTLAEKLAQMPLLERGAKGHAAAAAPESATSMLSSGRPEFVACLRGLTLLAELDMSLDTKLLPEDVKLSLPQLCVSFVEIRIVAPLTADLIYHTQKERLLAAKNVSSV